MIESKFNIYYTTPDGTQLVFNGVSCALAIVDEKYVELVRCLPSLTNVDRGHSVWIKTKAKPFCFDLRKFFIVWQ